MWIFGFFLGVCPIELCNLVFSLKYLVSNGRRELLGGIRLDGYVPTGVEHFERVSRHAWCARRPDARLGEDLKSKLKS